MLLEKIRLGKCNQLKNGHFLRVAVGLDEDEGANNSRNEGAGEYLAMYMH